MAKAAGLPQLPPVPVRWVRVPDGGPPAGAATSGASDEQGSEEGGAQSGGEGTGEGDQPAAVVALPAVLPPGESDRQLCGLEVYFPAPEEPSLAGLGSPHKRKPWTSATGAAKRPLLLDEDGLPLPPPPPGERKGYAPHSQEAMDAKSGKGKRRLFLHPVIRNRERCGKCAVSALPSSGLCVQSGWIGLRVWGGGVQSARLTRIASQCHIAALRAPRCAHRFLSRRPARTRTGRKRA